MQEYYSNRDGFLITIEYNRITKLSLLIQKSKLRNPTHIILKMSCVSEDYDKW